MNFKAEGIVIASSKDVLFVVDAFVHKGIEYALAEHITGSKGITHRICKWDKKENIAMFVDDQELLMRLTLEFSRRNPGVMSGAAEDRVKGKKRKSMIRNRLDTSLIGLLENFSACKVENGRQLKDLISDLDSVQSFKAGRAEKELLIEILASVFALDGPVSGLGEIGKTDFAVSVLLRLGAEEYMDEYIEKVLVRIPDLEMTFPHIVDAIKENASSRFAVASRYMNAELKRYEGITVRDAIFYSNSKEVLKLRNIVRKGLLMKRRLGNGSCMEFIKEYTPDKIVKYLDRYIAGQSEAKKAVAITLYRHAAIQAYPDKHLKKENLLVYGPSGCGKTELFRVLKNISPVPLHIRSAAELTANGYSGMDIDDLIMSLERRGKDISRSIVVLDEVDKLFMPEHGSHGENTNKSAQGDLLKVVEGSILTKDRKTADTENITFIFAGAFADLYDRKTQIRRPIGFGTETDSVSDDDIYFSVSDFTEFGVIPELARRISMFVPVRKLTTIDYKRIFTDIGNSIVDEVSQFLSINNMKVELESDDLIDELVAAAESLELGASGLRSIFSQAVNDKYYDAVRSSGGRKPEHETTITITKGDIRDAVVYFGKGVFERKNY